MSDAENKKPTIDTQKAGRILVIAVASLFCILFLTLVAGVIYLLTPLPAKQLSRYLTDSWKQQVTVKELRLSGKTLTLKGVRLQSPPGFSGADLARADVVRVRPRWIDLLRGERRFDLIAVEGGKVNLEKNAAGSWNFTELQRRLAAKPPKKPAPETVIQKLLVKNGSVTVQGQGAHGINLQVFNLTTGGSRRAQIDLAFEDASRNRYRLTGTARPGSDAAVDLVLSAPSLSLRNVATLLKLKNPKPLEKAYGSLQANAVLVKGELRSSGTFRFSRVQLPAARAGYPISGIMQFNGVYNLDEDRADLNDATLTIEKVAQVHAEGNVSGVKKAREFAFLIGVDQVELALLNVLLSDEARKGMLLGGELRCESLRLEGNGAKGLETAVGTLELRDGSLGREGKLYAAGLAGKAGVSRKGGGIAVNGKLGVSHPDQEAMVEALDLPFNLVLSPRLKLLTAQSGRASARVLGVPAAGRLSYDAGSDRPLAATVNVREAKLTSLNPLLKRYDMQAAAGSLSGSFDLAGKGGEDLAGTGRVKLSGFTGKRGKDAIGVKDGVLTAQLQKQGDRMQASGEARLTSLLYNGKTGDADFRYRLADNAVQLEAVQAKLGGTRFSAARIGARLPTQEERKDGRTPLHIDLEGGAVRQGEFEVANLAGAMRGSVVTAGNEHWLEGTAELSSRNLSWQGKAVSAPVLHATFAKAGGRAELSGRLFGGKLSGQAAFHPFNPQAGTNFNVALVGAAVGQLARLLPKSQGMRPTGGELDLRLDGGYAEKSGLSCRFDAKGRALAVASNGKKALSGGALFLAGRYSGGTLTIGEGLFSPGKGVALQGRGQIARVFSPKRQGTIALSLPETPLEALTDALLNILPPTIQEANLAGSVEGNAKLELRAGRQLLEGGVNVHGGKVEVPSQKLSIVDVNGRIPLSLDLAGKEAPQPRERREFSRENYQRVLAQLRQTPAAGETVTIAKVGFGTIGLGKVTAQLRADSGLMEITSLRTTLYDGELLGTGYLSKRQKLAYRGDLLLNGASLKAVCRSIPNLEGYISGRVDGVLSVSGAGGGTAGMTGFLDLWAREGGGEKMLVSREFLQRLAKQKLSGFFLSRDRRYDEAEIKATLQEGDLTFSTLKILNRNALGVRDLNVSIAPTQNRIALDHLLESIKEAAVRGTPAAGEQAPAKAEQKPESVPEFKWEE